MFCKKCGKQNENRSRFCRNCGENIFLAKNCPFCRKEINIDDHTCPNCKQILIEKITTNKKETADIPNHKNKISVIKIITSWILILKHKINIKKASILLGVIFIIWIVYISDSSVTNKGEKLPLPTPIQQNQTLEVKPDLILPSVSLSNGYVLKKNSIYLSGDGELEIKNGTNLDSVAKLIRNGTSVFSVYIKANSNYTITKITDGVYWLAFAQGLDWNSTTQKFQRNIQYSVFDETFNFITTDTEYNIFEITLNPVIGGTAETSSVDPSQFNAY